MALPAALRDVHDRLADLLAEAFEVGRRAGANEMREAILQAATSPSRQMEPAYSLSNSDGARSRAAKGEVRRGIKAAMRHMPGGIREHDIAVMARRLGIDINERSIGGELRRMRGQIYRQDGGLWFLIRAPSAEESAGSEEPADEASLDSEEAEDETAIAA